MKAKILHICTILMVISMKMTAQINLYTEDLPRFFKTFDAVVSINDSIKQTEIIQTEYLDKASKGLKEFLQMTGVKIEDLRKSIILNKENYTNKRQWILSVLNQEQLINKKIEKFKKLYPDFRDGDIYFCIGANRTGGTINDKTVYIGAEVIANERLNWALFTVMHEFTHTQQWTQRNMVRLMSDESLVKDYMSTHTQLLGRALEEGLADFVAELVIGESIAKSNPTGHTGFGLKNEQIVWTEFKKEMFLIFDQKMGWVSGKREINGKIVEDLGYLIGHQMCKSYYNKAKNKQQALKEMLATNFTDENAKKFLIASGYLTEKERLEIK